MPIEQSCFCCFCFKFVSAVVSNNNNKLYIYKKKKKKTRGKKGRPVIVFKKRRKEKRRSVFIFNQAIVTFDFSRFVFLFFGGGGLGGGMFGVSL